MAQVTLKGNPVHTIGELPSVGSKAKDFTLTRNDLSKVKLSDFAGKRKILSIFPSLDTGTCAKSVRAFNEKAAGLANTVILNISADLPFAQRRFCGAEGITNVETLSTLKSSFQSDYGIELIDSGMAGLCARAVVVLDEHDKVTYTQLVGEIGDEPDYGKAIAALG